MAGVLGLFLMGGCAEGVSGGGLTAPAPEPRREIGPDGREYASYSSMDAVPAELRTVTAANGDAKLTLSGGSNFEGVGSVDYNGTTVGMQLSMDVGFDNNQVAYITPPEISDHQMLPPSWFNRGLVNFKSRLPFTTTRDCGHHANFYASGWVAMRVLLNWSIAEIDRKPWSDADFKGQSPCQNEDGTEDGGGGGGTGGGATYQGGTCIVYYEFYKDTGEIIDAEVIACF